MCKLYCQLLHTQLKLTLKYIDKQKYHLINSLTLDLINVKTDHLENENHFTLSLYFHLVDLSNILRIIIGG